MFKTRIATFTDEARKHAAGKAGEHLDILGKTDLATMTADEWAAFIAVVCNGYCESFSTHGYYMLEDEIPF